MSTEFQTSAEKKTAARYSLVEMASRMSDVIMLGRGDPDFDTPGPIIEDALRMMDGSLERTSVRGFEQLRFAITDRYERDKGLVVDPEKEILITNGAQEGLFLALLALVNPGDGVLMADPRYSSYDQAVNAAGGRLVLVPTGSNHDFTLEPDEILKRADRGNVLVFVNPSNPTGAMVPPEGVRAIADVARRAGLSVIADEIYEGLVFDGVEACSLATCEGMRNNTVTLSGFSKTYAMTGFRVGFLIGHPSFIEAAASLKAAISGPGPLLPQCAALAALKGTKESVDMFRQTFNRRRHLMMQGLDDLKIPYGHPGGGFFVWADISRFRIPAGEFCRRLLSEAGVLMFPGTSFGTPWEYYVRISLLQPEEKIIEALTRLKNFLESASTRGTFK